MSIHTEPRINRRSVLAAGSATALLAGAGSLTGCSGSKSAQNNTAAKNAAVSLPNFTSYDAVKPDLPGTEQGVDNAFRTWPTDNPKSVQDKPGTGKETVSGMANIYYAAPPGPSRNSFWAGLNERLGVDLKLQMVGNADYTQKYATTIAGSDLPDVLQTMIASPGLVANLPTLLDKRFAPLDEHLSGDAVKDYPNLANIPQTHWKSTIFNGKIYGIPIPRGRIGNYNFVRQDLWEAKGLSLEPKGYDELLESLKALTNPKKRQWAVPLAGVMKNLLLRINEAPNDWRNDGGKLTRSYETDEFKQTVTDMIEVWKAGVLHPDAFDTAQPFKQLFNAGTVALNPLDGYPGWIQYQQDNASNPEFKLGLMPIYKRDGSELAPWFYGNGLFSMSSIKKQDSPDRLKLILRVLNWLAAPFGTEEYLYKLYGKEGVDHKMTDGDPVLTKTGQTNTVIPIRYLADSPYAIYVPGRPKDADVQHKYQSLEVPTGIANPTVGLFSNAYASKNATIDKNFNDGVDQIIQGRKPMSELDNLLSAWKSGGGDEMRKEYQDQLQKNGGPS